MSYTAFLIGDYTQAQQDNREPWLLPDKAFVELKNGFVHQGVLKKRHGSQLFDSFYRTIADIRGASQAALCEITTAVAHGLSNGDTVRISSVGGMVELNNRVFTVAVTAPTTFTIGINSTAYTPWTFGGCVSIESDSPIEGLLSYVDEIGEDFLLAFNDRRGCLYDESAELFFPIDAIGEQLNRRDLATVAYNGTLHYFPIVIGSLSITDGVETFSDNGAGVLTGDMGGTGLINYTTGVWSVTFNAAGVLVGGVYPPVDATYQYTGNLFSGDNFDLFQGVNFKNKLWITNGEDRILNWDGSRLNLPIFDLANEHSVTNGVERCDYMKVFKERLILLSTSESGDEFNQRVRWCQAGNPDVWCDTIAGLGDYLDVSDGSLFVGCGFVREDLVMFFQKGVHMLRYTGNPDLPFSVIKFSSFRTADSTFSVVETDDLVSILGKNGIISSNGNSVAETDGLVNNLVRSINSEYVQLCFSQRVEDLNQLWMTFPSSETVGKVAVECDRILVHNEDDDCWSYFTMPMSCFGYHKIGTNAAFNSPRFAGETFQTLGNFRFNSFIFIADAPVLLGGSNDGKILLMNHDTNDYSSTKIDFSAKTKNFNPFASIGKHARLAKIDLLLSVTSNTQATIHLYTDDETTPYISEEIDVSDVVDNHKAWFTIFSGATANFHSIRISSDALNETLEVHAMRLWMKPVTRSQP